MGTASAYEIRPLTLYAITCLFAALVGPLFGYIFFGLPGFLAVTALALVGILLTRSLFVTAPRASIAIVKISIGAVVTAILLVFSVVPLILETIAAHKSAIGCEAGAASWWCSIPNVPSASSTNLVSLVLLLIFSVLALNLIWFGRTGLARVLRDETTPGHKPARSLRAVFRAACSQGAITADEQILLIDGIRSGAVQVLLSPTVKESASNKPTLIAGSSEAKAVEEAISRPGVASVRQAPSPPPDFQGRTDILDDIGRDLLSGRSSLITAVRGLGGIGKTALAAMVVDRIRVGFPDGVLWIDANGSRSTIKLDATDAAGRLIHLIDPLAVLPTEREDRLARYRSTLSGRKVLVVIDDALDGKLAGDLSPPSPSALLVTSRRTFTLPGLTGLELPPLPYTESTALVDAILKGSGRELSADQMKSLLTRCAGLPLALRSAASFLAENPDWDTAVYLERLANERERLDALKTDNPSLDVRTVLGFSYDRVEDENDLLAERWRHLSLIPATFDLSAVAAIWGCEETEARDGLSTLRRRALLEFDSNTQRYRFHDLMRDLAEEKHVEYGEIIGTSQF